MLSKICLFLLFFLLCSHTQVKAQGLTDTIKKDYDQILTEKEQQAAEKKTDSLGTLIADISFQVKTDNLTGFKDGFIPWINLEYPEKELKQLIDKDEVVVNEAKITVIIDYPLTNEYRFELTSTNGFTRKQLVEEISKNYHKIYKKEEASTKVKTIPIDKRTTVYNRNQTNGKYGIWGHDLADLALDDIRVYRSPNGDIILSLNIES
jgi:L-fucose mutarotase/ribose pyranase (RbsD/FucU family)